MLFTFDDLLEATDLVRRYMPPTPQYAWPLLADELDAEVWVKHENHTPTGAFKVRGGLVHLSRLAAEGAASGGVVSATRGNHGQSLAFAGRAVDIPVTIVVPHGNSPEKNDAMRGFGADLVVHGHDFQAAREHSVALAEELGAVSVPPFHRDLVLGVATYAKELFDAAGQLETVYVPVGMGSGICALITVRDLLDLDTEIVGVVSASAPATKLSVDAGEVVATDAAATFVDGVACRQPDPAAIDLMVRGGVRIIAVPDDATAEAMRLLHRTTHNTPEPAGAIALAGAMSERDHIAGRRVGVIQTGGNVDTDMLATVLSGTTPPP